MSRFDPSNNDCVRYVYNFESVYDWNRDGFNVFMTKNDMKRLVKLCVDMEDGNIYSGPMVWIGIYIAIASVICTLAMAADLFHGFRNRKFWFPSKYFSLNAASITVITVTMKLPVDLSNSMPGYVDQAAKLGSMAFMCVMMANIMPSLASMDNKTLVANIIGLAFLIITMIVNICIELTTNVIGNWFFSSSNTKYDLMTFRVWACIYNVLMFLLLLISISLAITIPSSKKILELKYQAMSKTISNDQHRGMPTIEKLRQYVRRYWVMVASGSPQFVMASNPLSNASGIICIITLVTYIVIVSYIYFTDAYKDYQSDYKWATLAIFLTQFIRVVVGSIAPIFRCFTVLRFNLFSGNHLVVFKVEKYWTQMLSGWKETRLLSNSRKSRACVHNLKNVILSLCIKFQNIVVVSCKMIGLIWIVLIIIVMRCLYYWKSLKALLFNTHVASSSDDTNVDLSNYVLQIQDEMEFAEMTVKGISNSMNHLIKKVTKEQHNDLLELLEISTRFEGVGTFDIDQVESLLSVEPVNTWSLPIVTLTCIAVALPNIPKDKASSLLKGVGDGFSYIHLVEGSLNSAREYVKVRRATVNLWHEIEDNYKWLENTLGKNAFKGKTPAEVLKWFADKAGEIVIEVNKSTNRELMESFPDKLLVANSMYRIARTILLNFQRSSEAFSEEQLFALLSCMISDIVSACLINIPRVIATKCHESVIEKREASVESAARLLGRSAEIVRKLEARELPSMDPNKMAFIDEWRLHLKRSIP